MAGIEALMRTLSEETEASTRIRANSIDPGALRTAQRRELYPAEDPNSLPKPEQLTHAFLYLLGPDSRGVTGRAFSASPAAVPPPSMEPANS
jgi:NAD(P)-dependent dehydrogenase (short-subunit alcohol dehydrogenase family)